MAAVAETLGAELGWSKKRVSEEGEAWVEAAASEGLDPGCCPSARRPCASGRRSGSIPRSMALSDLHLADLHERARELEVPRYRMLTRDELIEAIEEAGAGSRGRNVGDATRLLMDDASAAPGGQPRSSRERRRRERSPEEEVETEEVTGVLDRMPQGYGFLRLSGLHSAEGDVYVSASQIRRCELRPGDEVSGPAREPRRGENHRALVRVASVNGQEPEGSARSSRTSPRCSHTGGCSRTASRPIRWSAPSTCWRRSPSASGSWSWPSHAPVAPRCFGLSPAPAPAARRPPPHPARRRASRGGHRMGARSARGRGDRARPRTPSPAIRFAPPSWRSATRSVAPRPERTWS